jgi:homoserine O-acetyltransferase
LHQSARSKDDHAQKREPALVTRIVFTALLLCYAASALADPSQKLFEGDYFIHGLPLARGEVMPELKLHYRTLGTPTHDETGLITNAILLLPGAGQDGETFLSEGFARAMFGPGQPLDALHYFLILADSIGSGKSSKPSDNRRLQFPHYIARRHRSDAISPGTGTPWSQSLAPDRR